MDKLLGNEESGKERAEALDQSLGVITDKLDAFKVEQESLKTVVKEVCSEMAINERLTKFNAGKIDHLERRLEMNDRDSRRLNLIIEGVNDNGAKPLQKIVNALFSDLQVGYTVEDVCKRIFRRGKTPLGNANKPNTSTPPPLPPRPIVVSFTRHSHEALVFGT